MDYIFVCKVVFVVCSVVLVCMYLPSVISFLMGLFPKKRQIVKIVSEADDPTVPTEGVFLEVATKMVKETTEMLLDENSPVNSGAFSERGLDPTKMSDDEMAEFSEEMVEASRETYEIGMKRVQFMRDAIKELESALDEEVQALEKFKEMNCS